MPISRVKKIQNQIDKVIDRVFLRYIPRSVTPNQVTASRFVLTAIMFYLLLTHHVDTALFVFAIAACTDFIDGAMARTRNQITDLGKVIDPLADKFLMICALAGFAGRHLVIQIVIIYIFLEMVAILLAVLLKPFIGRPVGANIFGKTKFVLQCIAAGSYLTGVLLNSGRIKMAAITIFLISLAFAIISSLETIRRKFNLWSSEEIFQKLDLENQEVSNKTR